MNKKLGLIGAGAMGGAIISRAVAQNAISASDLIAYDVIPEKTAALRALGAAVAGSAQELVEQSEFVFVAVKPQQFGDLASTISVGSGKTVISIMAGKRIADIRRALKSDCGIARAMPNMPCRIGKGVSAVAFAGATAAAEEFAIRLFSACGATIRLDESLFDAVTSMSGSGPAYVFAFIDSMIRAGMDGGLAFEQSKRLAVETVIGAAELAKSSDESPRALTESVCSKGGTTIEAIKVLDARDFDGTVRDAIRACRARSEELSNPGE